MHHFKRNIVWLRQSTHLSQEKFGELFSISRAQMDSYEKKSSIPTIPIVNKICKYFNITLDQIFNEELDENSLKKKVADNNLQLISELRKDKEDLRELNRELKEQIKELKKQIVALQEKLPADPLSKRQKASHS